MNWLFLDSNTQVNMDDIVKIEFTANQGTILGQEVRLFIIHGNNLALSTTAKTIPALQQLRHLIGGGAGQTEWVRVRREGSIGDNEDSYVNLSKVTEAKFTTSPDGDIARLKARNGTNLGEVHLPAALQKVRELVREE